MHMTSPKTTNGFSSSRRTWKRALNLATIGYLHLGAARLHQVRPMMLLVIWGKVMQGVQCRYFILATSDTSKIDASVGCPVPPFFASLVLHPRLWCPVYSPAIRDVYRKLLGSTLTTTIITSTTTQILPGTTTETRPGLFSGFSPGGIWWPPGFEMIRYDSTTFDLVEAQFEFNFLSSRWRRICKNNERSLYGCGYNVVGWVGVIDDMRHHKQYVMSLHQSMSWPFSSCKVKLPYNFNLLNLTK